LLSLKDENLLLVERNEKLEAENIRVNIELEMVKAEFQKQSSLFN
jgi:hypothetical protein